MATEKSKTESTVKTVNNAYVYVLKDNVVRDGVVIKELYYLSILTENSQIVLNVGKKTYESVKNMTNGHTIQSGESKLENKK